MFRAASPLAPADCQRNASSWNASRALWRLGAAPSKTQLFRCFHKVQAPSITRELNPFLCCSSTFFNDLFHRSAKEDLLLGTKVPKFRGCKTWNQNCRAQTHAVRMCWIISSTWSEGTMIRVRKTFFSSQSAVQQQFQMASIRKFCISPEPKTSIRAFMVHRWWSQRKWNGKLILWRICLLILWRICLMNPVSNDVCPLLG